MSMKRKIGSSHADFQAPFPPNCHFCKCWAYKCCSLHVFHGNLVPPANYEYHLLKIFQQAKMASYRLNLITNKTDRLSICYLAICFSYLQSTCNEMAAFFVALIVSNHCLICCFYFSQRRLITQVP